MQVVRTVIWVLLLVALAVFTYANWIPVSVRIWDNLLVDTMLPAIVVLSFVIGFVPLWLYHRAAKWQLHRRIASLEAAARAAAVTAAQVTPVADPVPPVAPADQLAPEPSPAPAPITPPGAPLP
jgi:putative membrane protein